MEKIDVLKYIVTAFYAVFLFLSARRDKKILTTASKNFNIGGSPASALFNSLAIAVQANIGRFLTKFEKLFYREAIKHETFEYYENKYDKYYRVIMILIAILLLNLLALGFYVTFMFATSDYMEKSLANSPLNSEDISFFVLIGLILSSIIKYIVTEVTEGGVLKQDNTTPTHRDDLTLVSTPAEPLAGPSSKKQVIYKSQISKIHISTIVDPEKPLSENSHVYPEDERENFLSKLNDPASAKSYLIEMGLIDENGKLRKDYGNSK